jgi:hypothetical protein
MERTTAKSGIEMTVMFPNVGLWMAPPGVSPTSPQSFSLSSPSPSSVLSFGSLPFAAVGYLPDRMALTIWAILSAALAAGSSPLVNGFNSRLTRLGTSS